MRARGHPFSDALYQCVQIEGLLNVVPGSLAHEANGLFNRAVAGHEHQRWAAAAVALQHGGEQATAVAVGQTDIAEHQRIQTGLQRLARGAKIAHQVHVVVFQAQAQLQRLAHDGVVLDDQDSRGGQDVISSGFLPGLSLICVSQLYADTSIRGDEAVFLAAHQQLAQPVQPAKTDLAPGAAVSSSGRCGDPGRFGQDRGQFGLSAPQGDVDGRSGDATGMGESERASDVAEQPAALP